MKRYNSISSNHEKLNNENDENPRLLAIEVILKKKGIPQHNKCVKQVKTKKYEERYLIIYKTFY